MARRALLSVYDKQGLVRLAQALIEADWELVASGGTAAELRQADLAVTSIEQLTGLPPLLEGRVKTLHPAIHAGILAPRRPSALAELEAHGWRPIDLVVANLYPFAATVARPEVTEA